jgi:hypothetical protein
MKNEDILLTSFIIILNLHMIYSQFMPGVNSVTMNTSRDLELFQKVYNNMQILNSINSMTPNIFNSQAVSNWNVANFDPSQLVINYL